MKRLLYLLIVFIIQGCALHIPSKYLLNSEIADNEMGSIKSDTEIPLIVLENAGILKEVEISDSLFNRNHSAPYQVNDISEHISLGKDEYFICYRNYIGACCDSKGVGTYLFISKIVDGGFDVKSSLLLDTGPWQLPHRAYHIDKIEKTDNQKLLVNATYLLEDGSHHTFEIDYSINENWSLDDYRVSREKLQSKI